MSVRPASAVGGAIPPAADSTPRDVFPGWPPRLAAAAARLASPLGKSAAPWWHPAEAAHPGATSHGVCPEGQCGSLSKM